jgi:hypothetical protein
MSYYDVENPRHGRKALEENMAEAPEVEVSSFINRYNETFATYDGEQIAKLYCAPSITMRGDGSIHCFQSHDEIARFFQGVVDTYRREGAAGGTPHDVVAVPIGERKRRKAMAAIVQPRSLRRRLAHPCYDISPERDAGPMMSVPGQTHRVFAAGSGPSVRFAGRADTHLLTADLGQK